MKSNLELQRRKLLREIDRVNRKIVWTQQSMARLQSRIASLSPASARAA
jgi:hypothetical protein